MVGLPVAVFLHNRFSASLFSPPRLLANHDRLVAVVAARPRSTTPQRLSFFAFCLYLPNRCYPRTHPPCLRAHLVGGCILITFMSSDIPARFIALTPADSSDHPSPPSNRLSPPLSFFLLLHVFPFSASKSKPFLFPTKFPSFPFLLLPDTFHLFFFFDRDRFFSILRFSLLFFFFLYLRFQPTSVLFVLFDYYLCICGDIGGGWRGG